MGDPAQTARVAAARRRVKRAAGQLREAAADLAAASDATSTVAVVHADRDRYTASIDEVDKALAAGLAKYPAVDVVILARTDGRPPKPR